MSGADRRRPRRPPRRAGGVCVHRRPRHGADGRHARGRGPRPRERGAPLTAGQTPTHAKEEDAMRVAVVTPRMASGERGGAEALYRGLLDAFRSAGHDALEVPVHTDESSFTAILESYARCYALDLREYDMVVST